MTLTAVSVSVGQLRKKALNPSALAAVVVVSLAVTALSLLVIPELIYVKDIYPNHPRANTMFKLTFEAFVLMGLLGGWLVGYVQHRTLVRPLIRVAGTVLVGMLIIGFGAYPLRGFHDYYGGWEVRYGLNGMRWMQRDEPEALAIINWLNKLGGRPTIVEAVGESYTTFNRVSAFTGLPTIVGWRVHEWLWRGGFDIPSARSEEVRKIYEEPTQPGTLLLLAKYDVQYIIVGAREREAYPNIDEAGLQRLGSVVFGSGSSYILAVQ